MLPSVPRASGASGACLSASSSWLATHSVRVETSNTRGWRSLLETFLRVVGRVSVACSWGRPSHTAECGQSADRVRTECGQSADSADTSGRFPVEFRGEFSDCPSEISGFTDRCGAIDSLIAHR
jgi:hypothetical protein